MWNLVDCPCQGGNRVFGEELLHAFAAVREQCAALEKILVPDELWPDFQTWCCQPPDEAHHQSILLLAMERGHLGRVTASIHRYLMEAGVPRPTLRKQYLQDLQERWMAYDEPLERHQRVRAFLGRLVELQCAEWLESLGWTISELEALREGPDIEATTANHGRTAFEVKFIGQEDADFSLVLRSLKGEPAGRWASHYVAANYLLFRTYEAAKQLQHTPHGRIALVVVEDRTWTRFRLPLKWIRWHDPRFFEGDPDWEKFLKSYRPAIDADLGSAIRDLNAIWILRHSYGYEYACELKIDIRHAPNTYEAPACQGQKAPVTKRSSSLSRRRFRK